MSSSCPPPFYLGAVSPPSSAQTSAGGVGPYSRSHAVLSAYARSPPPRSLPPRSTPARSSPPRSLPPRSPISQKPSVYVKRMSKPGGASIHVPRKGSMGMPYSVSMPMLPHGNANVEKMHPVSSAGAIRGGGAGGGSVGGGDVGSSAGGGSAGMRYDDVFEGASEGSHLHVHADVYSLPYAEWPDGQIGADTRPNTREGARPNTRESAVAEQEEPMDGVAPYARQTASSSASSSTLPHLLSRPQTPGLTEQRQHRSSAQRHCGSTPSLMDSRTTAGRMDSDFGRPSSVPSQPGLLEQRGFSRPNTPGPLGFSRPNTPGALSRFSRPTTPGTLSGFSRPNTPGALFVPEELCYKQSMGERPQTAGLDEQRPSPSSERHATGRPQTAGMMSPYSDWSILEHSARRAVQHLS